MNVLANKYETYLSNANVSAMLQVIGDCEGAKYNTLFGGGTFNDFSKHPNKVICRNGLCSTAAGKYQFLFKTWNEVQKKLGLKDFSPKSQDIAAVYLIARRRALKNLIDGDLPIVLKKLSYEWASIPPSRYGQKTRSEKYIYDRFKRYSGTIKDTGATILPAIIALAVISFFIVK